MFVLMKGKRNVFFFILKADIGEVKVLIEFFFFKILSKIVVIFCLCLLRAVKSAIRISFLERESAEISGRAWEGKKMA